MTPMDPEYAIIMIAHDQERDNRNRICRVDWDDCYTICTVEEPIDCVLFDVAQGPDGWYLSIVVDCNTGGFTETMTRDDGPYKSEEEALWAAFDGALDWFITNEIQLEEIEIDNRLTRFAWWLKERT